MTSEVGWIKENTGQSSAATGGTFLRLFAGGGGSSSKRKMLVQEDALIICIYVIHDFKFNRKRGGIQRE